VIFRVILLIIWMQSLCREGVRRVFGELGWVRPVSQSGTAGDSGPRGTRGDAGRRIFRRACHRPAQSCWTCSTLFGPRRWPRIDHQPTCSAVQQKETPF